MYGVRDVRVCSDCVSCMCVCVCWEDVGACGEGYLCL
jgi:hypothetical protein